LARVSGGRVRTRRGLSRRALRGRGARIEMIWRVDAEIFSGARRVRPGFFERDDRWGPSSAAGEGGRGYRFGRGRRWAAGRFWIQAGFCPRGLLNIFLFFFLFSFLFSFEFRFETFTNF
jgi:hypothetical protein